MSEENPFYEGQKVVCITDNFPVIRTTKEDKSKIGTLAPVHPKKGETLVIDEILGPFIRFSIYDTDAFNWWHFSMFRALDDFEITDTFIEKHLVRIKQITDDNRKSI